MPAAEISKIYLGFMISINPADANRPIAKTPWPMAYLLDAAEGPMPATFSQYTMNWEALTEEPETCGNSQVTWEATATWAPT